MIRAAADSSAAAKKSEKNDTTGSIGPYTSG
jgi:hypothetical protein